MIHEPEHPPAPLDETEPRGEGVDEGDAEETEQPGTGLYVYGVVRQRGWRAIRVAGDAEDLVRVRFRDLQALIRGVPYELPGLGADLLQAHQRTVERINRRTTIVPLPYGIVFRSRRTLLRMLQDQYLALDEALSYFDGHYELRLHVAAPDLPEVRPDLTELATHIYTELRRFARAGIPMAPARDHVFSAAFLVPRPGWIDFVERAEDLGQSTPELTVDVTGPWPPYDFVRLVPETGALALS